MTDLWELTGPQPSDPCGIEGTPPNLSELDIESVPIKKKMTVDLGLLGEHSITIIVGTQLKVSVRARDNVGLKWVEFRIEGRGKEKVRFNEGVNNSTATAYFECDLLGSVFFGYDLNITVSDRNGNAGYLEKHINSMLENFVAWVLGAVTALAKFVMELASAAIEWVWNYIEAIASGLHSRLVKASSGYVFNLISAINNAHVSFSNHEVIDEESNDKLFHSIFSPFFITIFSTWKNAKWDAVHPLIGSYLDLPGWDARCPGVLEILSNLNIRFWACSRTPS